MLAFKKYYFLKTTSTNLSLLIHTEIRAAAWI